MIPAPFGYVRPSSVEEALEGLARDPEARVIAGGQSLLPLLKFRLAQPTMLIDISRLPALAGVEPTGSGVRIGGGTTYRDLLANEALRQSFPILVELTNVIGDRQVRNMGTVGGGLAHADPAADMPAAMLALGATFTLRSAEGSREVAAADFFRGPFTTALADGELLTSIEIPSPAGPGAYVKFAQPGSGFALVGAAVVVTPETTRVAFSGVGDAPFVTDLDGAEAALAGLDVREDIHAPADYRRHLALVAAKRAVAAARGRS